MPARVMTSSQKDCLSFYYHRRDQGGVPAHDHDAHQISITIGRPVDVNWWTERNGHTRLTATPGSAIVNPAGEPHAGDWDGPWENIGFYVDRRLTEMVARDLGAGAAREIVPACEVGDIATYGLARALLQDIDADPLSCRLYAESLANVLAARLLSGRLQPAPACRGTAPALSGAAMRRVESYVADNLDRNLCVSEIAAVVELSAFHFSRRFKARTGISPYEFVTRQRIARARDLLDRTALPLSEIALRAGFSSQSHLCARFRKTVGTTPRRYRERS